MKSGGPLQRYTPLANTTPLPRSTIGRNQGPKLPAKRPRVAPAVPLRIRVALQARSGGTCEILMPGCDLTAVDPAHRIKQGMGGRKGEAKAAHDVLSNLLHACRRCHDFCHANPARAYDLGLMLREWQTPTADPALYRGQFRWLTDWGLVLTTPPTAEEATNAR